MTDDKIVLLEARRKMTAKPHSPKPCPLCKKPSAETFKPFCSKRCAERDLHHWLAGSYSVPLEDGPAIPEADEE